MPSQATNIQQPHSNPLKSPFLIGTALLWFSLVLGLAINGYFNSPDGVLPIKMPIFFAIPLIVFLFLLSVSSTVSDWADKMDITTLTSFQTWRVMGFTFVILWAMGQLPFIFAIFAGVGDVLVGISAAFATVKVSQRSTDWKNSARRVIYIGLLDFAVAVITGLASAAGYLKIYSGEVSAHIMTIYPMVLFPTFFVPCFIILHILAWRKIPKE
jgi:hypothetical protein